MKIFIFWHIFTIADENFLNWKIRSNFSKLFPFFAGSNQQDGRILQFLYRLIGKNRRSSLLFFKNRTPLIKKPLIQGRKCSGFFYYLMGKHRSPETDARAQILFPTLAYISNQLLIKLKVLIFTALLFNFPWNFYQCFSIIFIRHPSLPKRKLKQRIEN